MCSVYLRLFKIVDMLDLTVGIMLIFGDVIDW